MDDNLQLTVREGVSGKLILMAGSPQRTLFSANSRK
jgi:hypothetical protein